MRVLTAPDRAVARAKARRAKGLHGDDEASRARRRRGRRRSSTAKARQIGANWHRWWRRSYPALRRDLGRARPLILFCVLSAFTLTAYGFWTSGQFERAGAALRQEAGGQLAQAGLQVSQITVGGNAMVNEASVHGALGARLGQPLLEFDADAARERVEALSWVRSAQVMRLLPDRLHVQLVERTAFCVWQIAGAFYLIDRDGVQLEELTPETAPTHAHLPHVVGAGANLEAAALLDLLDTAPALRSRLKAASRVGERRWNLRLDNGIDVRLPDRDTASAIEELAYLDREHRILARPIALIDLRNPDLVRVRPRADAPGGGLSDLPGGVAAEVGSDS